MLKLGHFPKSHTGRNIYKNILEIIEDFGLMDVDVKKFFVTDNAPNMICSIRFNADWVRIPCFDHTLQLAIVDSRKVLHNYLKAISKI